MPPLFVRVLFRLGRLVEQCFQLLVTFSEKWLEGEGFVFVLVFDFLLGIIIFDKFSDLMVYDNKSIIFIQTILCLLAFLCLTALIYSRIHSWFKALIERVKRNRALMRTSIKSKPKTKPKPKEFVKARYHRS
ncbi:MAG: hypothetical protein H6P99_2439 [Holophagaceae bacterium]|nr:hypothetical protein [Holophagaceae bacterium]